MQARADTRPLSLLYNALSMSSITNILVVALGGALGSVSRYLLGSWTQQAISKSIDFPYGTLAVNLIGCFMIGFLSQLVEGHGAFTAEIRTLVFVGVLGGFTTFSSFGNDTVNLLRNGETVNALANVGANVIFGLTLVWFGRVTSSWMYGVNF